MGEWSHPRIRREGSPRIPTTRDDAVMHAAPSPYELVDAGDDRRLERFGAVVVDRPAPTALAPRREPSAWDDSSARFAAGAAGGPGRWTIAAPLPEPWLVELEQVTFELRPTDTGQVGLFPEHAAQWPWLRDRTIERLPTGPVDVLHLFAYTGGATLAVARIGGRVVHVDASRSAVAWARRNADRSGLGDRTIRWIVDDAGAFAAREVRRGRRYAGLVLDPPSYGHGPRGETWRLADDLDGLLAACAALLEPDGFALLTAHTPGEDPDRLGRRLEGLRRARADRIEVGDLVLEGRSGTRLHLGAWARLAGPR
jgi:23S rRNA (cytosine1962-C5)-methyltransferase